jgi:Fe-S-cluster-containing hydrogenase component 2
VIRLHIVDERCQLCQPCRAAEACRVRAIVRLERDEAPYIDVQRCYDCRLCLPACTFAAVALNGDL